MTDVTSDPIFVPDADAAAAELRLAHAWLIPKKLGGLGCSPTKAQAHIDKALSALGGHL